MILWNTRSLHLKNSGVQRNEPQVFHVHQMSVIDHGDQNLTRTAQGEGLLDQPAFALEGRAFELDFEGFAEDLAPVGVSVLRAGDRGDQGVFLR